AGPSLSSVQGDVDLVAAQLDAMRGHRFERGEAEGLPRPDVEPRSVTRALDLDAVEFPLGERAAIMGAYIIDGIKTSIDVKEGDRPAVDFRQRLAAGGQFGAAGDFHEFGHGSMILVSALLGSVQGEGDAMPGSSRCWAMAARVTSAFSRRST